MRKIVVAVAIAVAGFVGFGAGVESAATDPQAVTGTYDTPSGTLTVFGDESARFDPAPVTWQEDTLPERMYAYVETHGADLRSAPGEINGHRNCWLAVADTTLVMCPDGWSATS